MDEIDELKDKISKGEIYSTFGKYRNTFYFKSSLSNAMGFLARIENPPKGKSNLYSKDEIEKIIFNLQSSMENPL